jgi:hypothetical protein
MALCEALSALVGENLHPKLSSILHRSRKRRLSDELSPRSPRRFQQMNRTSLLFRMKKFGIYAMSTLDLRPDFLS